MYFLPGSPVDPSLKGISLHIQVYQNAKNATSKMHVGDDTTPKIGPPINSKTRNRWYCYRSMLHQEEGQWTPLEGLAAGAVQNFLQCGQNHLGEED